jgi:endonuclease/exonuclease/phosphatase family metal-dependent hydrolase
VPPEIELPGRALLRPLDLRRASLRLLGRERPRQRKHTRPGDRKGVLRVMTYNVHGCRGMDGRLSTERIARVISRHEPDVVALQELDLDCRRSDRVDQARQIAQLLYMQYYFHPAIRFEQGEYGDAILSRFPLEVVKTGLLGVPSGGEPRGALWIRVLAGGARLHVINTHLGILPGEQRPQLAALLGPDWLGRLEAGERAILCGDFNAPPWSPSYRRILSSWTDVQLGLPGYRARNTWLSALPFQRIDHIFTTPGLRVVSVAVPRTTLSRMASDHLPLMADLDLVTAAI